MARILKVPSNAKPHTLGDCYRLPMLWPIYGINGREVKRIEAIQGVKGRLTVFYHNHPTRSHSVNMQVHAVG